MSSRKRHLLAFALTLLLVLPPLLWLAARLGHAQAPASAGHAVPIRLSELAPAVPRTPARKSAPARTAPPAKAADKPAPAPNRPHKNAVEKSTRSTPPPKRTLQKPPKAKPRPAKPRKTPAKPPVRKTMPTKPAPAKPARPAPPRHNTAPQTSRHTASTEPPRNPLRRQPTASDRPAPAQSAHSAAPAPTPAATAPAPAAPPTPPAWLGERQRYLDRLRQHIARLAQDTYPYRARRLGMQGTVTLHFTLHPDGRIDRLSVRQRSGHEVLDEAARAIIEEAMGSRFDPFPPALPHQPIEVTIPIRYRLR